MDTFEILQRRGFLQQCTGESQVRELLSDGGTTFYAGYDPTGESLHAGSLVPIMAMAWLQRGGHRAIALVGSGTAMVGDPSGKTEARTLVDRAIIEQNAAGIRGQLAHFLSLDGERGLAVDNAEWLEPLHYIEFLREIGSQFSVNRMLAAEAYRARLERGLSFIEFNYQLLQAYDYLCLYRRYGCTLQVGGDDQWGNILAGTELVRRLEGADVHGLTVPLLTTATGAKMGKTAKGSVWLSGRRLSPFDYFQYWYNCDDRDVGRFLRMFTFLPLDEISRLEALQGAELREAKWQLAHQTTALAHGEQAALVAEKAARSMVAGTASDDLPTHAVGEAEAAGSKVYVLLHDSGITRSRGEGRRLIKQGGVRLNGARVVDAEYELEAADYGDQGAVIRVGKKRAVRVVIA